MLQRSPAVAEVAQVYDVNSQVTSVMPSSRVRATVNNEAQVSNTAARGDVSNTAARHRCSARQPACSIPEKSYFANSYSGIRAGIEIYPRLLFRNKAPSGVGRPVGRPLSGANTW